MPVGKQVLFYAAVLRDSVASYFGENMPANAAALAFYMIFSLPSMLFIVLWTTGHFYRDVAVREAIFNEIGVLVGDEGAQQFSAIFEGLNIQEPTWWATVVGVGVLLFTGTTVLITLYNSLNRIFKVRTVQTAGAGIWRMVRNRFISLALVITIAFILLVFLMVDAMITAFGTFAVRYGGEWVTFMVKYDSIVLDVGANTILFALTFRYLPDIRLAWKDIWFGALLTAVFFSGGKHLIALIIGNSTAAGMYQAAGSVLVLMLWIYYASAIFLFGATFTFTRAQLMNPKVAKKNLGVHV